MNEKKQLRKEHKRKEVSEDKSFLVLLLIFGCVFLTVAGEWHVYTDPVRERGSILISRLGIELPEIPGKTDKPGEGEKDDLQAGAEDGSREDPEPEAVSNGEPWEEGVEEGDSVTEEEDRSEPEPEPEPESEPDIPVFQTVGDDYFNDAVFIGDSRTVGMYEYSSLKETSTFYASVGLSVHKLFTAKIVEVPGQRSKITVEQALSENQFSKIYYMIGINEMGTGTVESFLEAYSESVQRLHELQPDAIIYLQGIMQVTGERSARGDYITNEGIAARNEGIRALADDESIFYLEVNEALCDENGAMREEYSGDGVHLKAQYVDLWKEYLKNHAIVKN